MDALPPIPVGPHAGEDAVSRAILLGLLALLWSSNGISQPAAFEPLRRAEDEADAQLVWEIAAAYYPRGVEGAGFDEYIQYFTFVRFIGERQLELSSCLSFNRRHKVGIAIGGRAITLRERRKYASHTWEETSTVFDFAQSSYYEYRIDPVSRFDPRVRISYEFPEGIGLAASASCVLDPIVLAGMLGLSTRQERPYNWVDLSLSAGLVANARVSFVASGAFSVPIHDTALPAAVVSLHTRYSLDPAKGLELSLQVSLRMQGQTAWVGIELAVEGRDP